MNKVVKFFKDIFSRPTMTNQEPPPTRKSSNPANLNKPSARRDDNRRHQEEMQMLLANIREQRQASQHYLNILWRNQILILMSLSISLLSVVIAIIK